MRIPSRDALRAAAVAPLLAASILAAAVTACAPAAEEEVAPAAEASSPEAERFPAIAADNFAQQLVDEFAQRYPNIKRLTIHTEAPEGSPASHWSFASTDPSRRGRESDEEDIRAMTNDEVVVLTESSSETPVEGELTVDVTFPLHDESGAVIGVAGVTLNYEVGADESEQDALSRAEEEATDIGRQIDEVIESPEHLSHESATGQGG